MKGRTHQHARHARRAELTQQDAFEAPIEARQPNPDPALQTIVSVVYVTAEPTFTGSIAGYSTVGQEEEEATSSEVQKPTSQTKPAAIKTTATSASSQSHSATVASTLKTSASSSTELPSSIVAISSVGSSIALLAATHDASTSSLATHSSASASAPVSASSTAAADSSSSGGMSAGGKAGLAIGILLFFGAALAMLLFVFRKKKQAAKSERIEDEKAAMVASSARRAEAERVSIQRQASQRSARGAHHLSLRPVTQFQPFKEKQEASQAPGQTGSMLTPISTALSYQSQPPGTANSDQNMNNPFGNHAEAIDTPNTNGPPIIEGFNAGGEVVAAATSASSKSPTPSISEGAAPVPAKPIGLARSASKAGNGLKQMDFTKPKTNTPLSPPSPSGSDFSTASTAQSAAGVAIAAAGGPTNTAVHRVQLDFAPSMDDELELKAGQLIRILHEYDDGWALCIRLDRSKQGVVPRTCLSTRSVKPRPQQPGPHGSPAMRQQRPMSPGMNQGPPRPPNKEGPPYPSSPMGNRAMPPNGPPRPMGPNGQGPLRGPGMMQAPLKPMPPSGQGPPRGPGMMQGPPRSMSPAGNRPMTPQSQRPMVPPNHPNQQRPMTPQGPAVPRPLTPQGQAIQERPFTSPNQQVAPQNGGRARSNSDTDSISRQPISPINTSTPMAGPSSQPPPNIRSPVERKPVPGQAI